MDQQLAINPNDASLWAEKTEILQRLNRTTDALESIEKAIFYDPTNYMYYSMKAGILTELNRNEEALEFANKGIIMNPSSVS